MALIVAVMQELVYKQNDDSLAIRGTRANQRPVSMAD